MTYNFDPDKWLDNEVFLLQERLKNMELTQEEFDEAIDALEIKHELMWQRLNNTYQVNQG